MNAELLNGFGEIAMIKKMFTTTTIIALLAATVAAQNNWAQFRGPGSLGVTEDPNLPDTWSTTQNVAWKTDIPGTGWSSPTVWGDNIFLTSVVSSVEGENSKKGLYFGGELKAPAKRRSSMADAVLSMIARI